MNRRMLDDRILFPGAILSGFAKFVLSTSIPALQVHGLMSRGHNNISLLVAQRGLTFQLGVRFRQIQEGSLIITTMHRRIRRPGDPFGTSEDERREFVEQNPEKRMVLQTTADAFRVYYMAAAHPALDRSHVVRERWKMEDYIHRAGFGDTFRAVARNGDWACILPTEDFSLHPERARQIRQGN